MLECPYCDKPYKQKKSWEKHVKKKHKVSVEEAEKKLEKRLKEQQNIGKERKYKCKHCSRKFVDKERRAEHEKISHQKVQEGKKRESEGLLEKVDSPNKNTITSAGWKKKDFWDFISLLNDLPSYLIDNDNLIIGDMKSQYYYLKDKNVISFNKKKGIICLYRKDWKKFKKVNSDSYKYLEARFGKPSKCGAG